MRPAPEDPGGERMTGEDAEGIIRRILDGSMKCRRPDHFWKALHDERFIAQDINPILRSHILRGAPEWIEVRHAFRVRLVGKCLRGRPSLLVVDLRVDGPCTLVSIMVDNASPKQRRAR